MPALPFSVAEYGWFSAAEARKLFRGQPGLHRAWGALHVHDAEGKRYTLLGDRGWVRSFAAQAVHDPAAVAAVQEPLRGGVEVAPSGEAVSMDRMDEWPLEEFRPAWVILLWPDEWAN